MTQKARKAHSTKVIEFLASQPNKDWVQTQQALAAELDLAPTELSFVLRDLVAAGQVKRGKRIPGARGKNSTIELVQQEISQRDYLAKLRVLQGQLSDERQFRIRFATERQRLEAQLKAKDDEIAQMRGELNRLIIQVNGSTAGKTIKSGFKIYEILGDEERQMLANLTRTT